MTEYKTYTATFSTSKYDDPIIEDFIDFVYKAKSETDAVENTKRILKRYKKSLTTRELIKLLFNK